MTLKRQSSAAPKNEFLRLAAKLNGSNSERDITFKISTSRMRTRQTANRIKFVTGILLLIWTNNTAIRAIVAHLGHPTEGSHIFGAASPRRMQRGSRMVNSSQHLNPYLFAQTKSLHFPGLITFSSYDFPFP
jgi:hypothetical protein